MTLYLKYRPKNLDDLDLPEVSESLKKIVASYMTDSKGMPHAFLFAGPKGTGKTSAARILAKIINCEHPNGSQPCNKCEQCVSITNGTNIDVIEMDAASHRGIEDVRTLRDAVKLAPAKSNKKIYIIDEAHMLTTEASNALLKTLEEPPEHVIFILATTNPEKLIETIRSRTTLISFRKANTEEIIKSLKKVVLAEKVKITDQSLTRMAEISGGAFRDAIKILEQYIIEGEEYLEKFRNSELESFVEHLSKKDEKSAISEIEKNISAGVSMDIFLQDLLNLFHKGILAEVGIGQSKLDGFSKTDLIELCDLFTEASGLLVDSPIEELPVEIAVIKWCSLKGEKQDGERVKEDKSKPARIATQSVAGGKDESASALSNSEFSQESVGIVNDDIWKKILSEIHPINVSIEGLLRASRPVSYDGKTLTLGVFYKFHKERLEDAAHRKVLEDVIEKVLNCPTRIACMLVTPPPKKIIEEAKSEPVLTESADRDIIKAAEEIFGN